MALPVGMVGGNLLLLDSSLTEESGSDIYILVARYGQCRYCVCHSHQPPPIISHISHLCSKTVYMLVFGIIFKL